MSFQLSRLIVIMLMAFCLPMTVSAETVNRVVAVVNGVNLYDSELNQEISALMPMNQSFHGNLAGDKMKKVRSDAMKNLVEYELKAQDAESKGLKISPQVLVDEMEKISSKFKSKEDFAAACQAAGLTEKDLTVMLTRRLLSEKIQQLEVDAKVSVNPGKVKKYYEDNVSRYSKPEEFRASQILVKVDPSSTMEQRSALRARAEGLLKRIIDGEPFADVAAKESDDLTKIKGGDLGNFHLGQALPELEDELVKLKVGQKSAIVETLYGYHIIFLTDRRPPRQLPFEEVMDKINRDLVEAEKKQLLETWMGGLYKKSKIIYPGEK